MGRCARCDGARHRNAGASALRLDVVDSRTVWDVLAHAIVAPAAHRSETVSGPSLTVLQLEGIARARHILARHGGVIVADSVGMGKTHIGIRLIGDAVADDAAAVLVIPAMLRSKWSSALRAAGLSSAGHDRGATPPNVVLTTHTLVHRVSPLSPGVTTPLIVVDEAHQFRNPRTARYRALARLTVAARVVMLTATPINNRPEDLYWLLRLFLGDGGLACAGIPDLRAALLDAEMKHAGLIRRITREVVIRRTRDDWTASDVATERVRFPARHPPKAVQYALDADHLDWLAATLQRIGDLRLTAVDVGGAMRGMRSRCGTAGLVRIGLVKRLESSAAAFQASVVRLLSFLQAFAEAVGSGGYLRSADVRTRDPLQLALTHLLLRPLPRDANPRQLLDDAAADVEALCTCLGSMPPDVGGPKARALAQLLDALEDDRRVVFTEFAETAEALFHVLPSARTALLHGTRCAIASGPASRRGVLERFAPGALGAAAVSVHESVHTLIATDVLAEGVDLQDARHCISYDLPWNPVRLMQRAGRVDRLGSPHEDVFVWYFLPEAGVERMLGLLRRLEVKTATIERMVGAEHGAVLSGQDGGRRATRRPSDGARWQSRLGELLHPVGEPLPRPVAPGKVPAALLQLEPRRMEVLLRTHCCPPATATPAAPGQEPHVSAVVLGWQRAGTRWVEGTLLCGRQRVSLDAAVVARLLCLTHAHLTSVESDARESRPVLHDALFAACSGRDETTAADLHAQVADAVRAALMRDDLAADARICRQADLVLRQLRDGVPAGAVPVLRGLLKRRHELGGRDLVQRLRVLTAARVQSRRRQLIGVLLIRSANACCVTAGARSDGLCRQSTNR